MSTYIPQSQAEQIVDQINAMNPPCNWSEQAKLAYAETAASTNQGPNGERDYYAVWKSNGFNQNCKNVGDMIAGYSGSWQEMIRNEYNAYVKSHQDASQWGLPEGVTWTYVE